MATEIEVIDEQLASVRAAMAKIEGGAQSYSMADKALSRPEYAALAKREEILLKRRARLSRSGPRVRFAEPM